MSDGPDLAIPIDSDLQREIRELAQSSRVAGWSCAVFDAERVHTAAGGVTNLRTGVEATPDTLFQIGSITKLYTATVIMRLVERGLLGLDDPVRRHIPDLELHDSAATEAVTVRHLLTHTSGIDGDNFDDHGRDDDCIARLVASYRDIPQLHDVGEMFAYSNAGYVFLGRIIELLTGKVYDTALKELLVSPLGLTHTVTLPEDAIMFRAAVGHFALGGGPPMVAPVWSLNRSGGPAGSTLCTTAAELAGFARMHLDDGRSPKGASILSGASVRAMQEPQFVHLAGPGAGRRGLGWAIDEVDGERILGHGGLAMGGNGQLHVLPSRRVAVAVLSNTASGGFAGEAARRLLHRMAGVSLAEPTAGTPAPRPVDPTADLSRYAGTFERYGVSVRVEQDAGTLVAQAGGTSLMGILLGSTIPTGTRLLPAGDDVFVADGRPQAMTFRVPGPDGRMRYLDLGGRVLRRAG